MTSIRHYDVSARGYLSRARARLEEGTGEALFYAAFELRCGIQARLQEYLEPREDVNQKLKSGWKIPQLASKVDPGGQWGDRLFRMVYHDPRGDEVAELLYTPVTQNLQTMAGKLGGYLHAAKSARELMDPWWAATRRTLEQIAQELATATRGHLLAVPVVHHDTGRVTVYTEVPPGANLQDVLRDGQFYEVYVEWLDHLPPDAGPPNTPLQSDRPAADR